MDSTQIKPEVKSTDNYLPPRPSILSLSLGSSGLWSCVTSTALTKSSLGSSWTPSTTPESPTWATYIFDPRIITTLAVVPDVLGRPVMVFGHSAAVRKKANKNTFVFNAAEPVTFWRSRLRHRGLHYVTTGCAHNYGQANQCPQVPPPLSQHHSPSYSLNWNKANMKARRPDSKNYLLRFKFSKHC